MHFFKKSYIKRVKAWHFSVFYITVSDTWRNEEHSEIKN